MHHGVSIRLCGPLMEATAAALADRLAELHVSHEIMDAALVERLGGIAPAGVVCGLLAGHGVIVVVCLGDVVPEGESFAFEVAAHDTPDFAADKLVDALAERGFVDLSGAQGGQEYSPEEEEEVRRRLSDLGYIE